MTTLPEQLRAEVAQRIVTGRPWPASSLMIEASDEIERLHALTEGDPTSIYAETADLRAWKESAMSVLAEWDRVHDALGRPGPLGRSLALNTLAEVERLSAENERLREALRARDAPADPIEAEQSALEQGLAKLGADTPWMASVLTVLALTDAYMDEWDMVGTKGRAERRETLQKVIPPLLAKAESALIGSAAASLSETGGEGT